MSKQDIKINLDNEALVVAKSAGLEYVNDKLPGFTRKKRGNKFHYIDLKGAIIKDPQEIKRINSLAIPPAYEDVWICPKKIGHLQATGRDARGRKQYRYHEKWRAVRDENKYTKTLAFAQKLPLIRKKVHHDLSLAGLGKEKILAAIVYLLETTLIRIGNEEYAKENKTFGLTTMRDRHVEIAGSKITFKFRGKSGQNHHIDLANRRLANLVKRCKDIPGQELFQYLDQEGNPCSIHSTDVNQYLKEITGDDFTAKDFRTWMATLLATYTLLEFPPFETETQGKKNIVQAIEAVAKKLGNTPAICRKCYIHPEVLTAYLEKNFLVTSLEDVKELTEKFALSHEELAVLHFLKKRINPKKI